MGVMPAVAGEPWKWAEQEAKANDELYKLFLDQEFKREQTLVNHDQNLKTQGLAQNNQREMQRAGFDNARESQGRSQDFAREGWDRQDERADARGAGKLDAQALKIHNRLVKDLEKETGLPRGSAAGLVAEIMAESGDFKQLQELNPLVPGSRGGGGYAQWTGPRRIAFEQYLRKNGYTPDSYEGNKGFLVEELKGPEGAKLIPQLMKAKDAWEAAQMSRSTFFRPQSVIEGWQDKKRDARVRSRLGIEVADDEPVQIAQAPAAVTPPAGATASAPQQPASGQQQPAAASKGTVRKVIGADGKPRYELVK